VEPLATSLGQNKLNKKTPIIEIIGGSKSQYEKMHVTIITKHEGYPIRKIKNPCGNRGNNENLSL
jgi:hypothetical protein